MHEVQRLSAADRAGFDRCVWAQTPAVIEGGARAFPATQRWTPEYLKARIGDVAIRFKLSSSHVHPDFRAATIPAMFATGAGTFAELVDAITTGEPAERARRLFTGDEQFVLQRRDGVTRIHEPFRPLLDDVAIPELFAAERLYTVWAWFSGPGVRTWLHYDNNGCHNLNAQITGAKDCVLFPPSELARLSPFPLGGSSPAHNCSQIDLERPDPERFPQLAAAERLIARLEAGDLLFIPAWWFHAFVHAGDFNCNVNFWWKPEVPAWNPVAARQALLDATAVARLDVKDPAVAQVLRRLDLAAIGG